MGLDMWLEKEVFVGGYYTPDNVKVDGKDVPVVELNVNGEHFDIDFRKVSSIREHVAYWREANAIHGWFIKNCADEDEECQNMFVSTWRLVELRELCQKILDEPEGEGRDKLAAEILPPCKEFFFGSTEIGERYYDQLRYTVEALADITENDDCDYYYSYSW